MSVVLKRGKEAIFAKRHHWIFSGAVAAFPVSFVDGGIYSVQSAEGRHLGSAYFNRKSNLVGRIVAWGEGDPHQALVEAIESAFAMRGAFFTQETTGYRLINAEGDGLPGLIVDCYGPYLVLQSGTLGMDQLKPFIIEQLCKRMEVRGIYERSPLSTRKEEGLTSCDQLLFGEVPERIEILEAGLPFIVDVKGGQKTGFFLDQREMRLLIGELARGRRLLNGFGYTGGFSVHALHGGARGVTTVDLSETALELARENLKRNGADPERFPCVKADLFNFLREKGPFPYDLVILDPPAFAKKRADLTAALKGYKEINREAMRRMGPGGLLLTCSCSYHVDEGLFQQMLFQAALEASRRVRILAKGRLAIDHPINLFHPEMAYLKSLLLYIE